MGLGGLSGVVFYPKLRTTETKPSTKVLLAATTYHGCLPEKSVFDNRLLRILLGPRKDISFYLKITIFLASVNLLGGKSHSRKTNPCRGSV